MRLLYELPLWIPLLLLAAGAGVWWQGNRTGDRPLTRLAYLGLAVAVALMAVSFLGKSPREVVASRSRQIITSASNRDWTTFASLLDANASFRSFPGYTDRATFAAGAQASIESIGLRSAIPTGVRVEPQGSEFVADIDCISWQDITMDRPVTTSWRMLWSQTDGAWLLREIEALPRPNLPPEEVIGHLRVPGR